MKAWTTGMSTRLSRVEFLAAMPISINMPISAQPHGKNDGAKQQVFPRDELAAISHFAVG